jgi:hypothetical protein
MGRTLEKVGQHLSPSRDAVKRVERVRRQSISKPFQGWPSPIYQSQNKKYSIVNRQYSIFNH